MRNKLGIFLVLLVILNLFMGYEIIKDKEREIIDLNEFFDYYSESEEENGGYILLDSKFKIYEKQYSAISEKVKEESVKRDTEIEYVVKKGDTLSGIANKFGQSQSVLKYNNPKTGKYLKIGEKLKITRGNSVNYKVSKGDSLSKIASLFGKSVNEIKEANNLTSNALQVNQNLIIDNPKVNLARLSKGKDGFNPYQPLNITKVNSPFGRRLHPVLKRWIGHMGVDLKAHYIDVRASEAGVVTFSGVMGGYGKLIIIKHSNGYETRYAHLNSIKVKKGVRVNRGQLIAQSGQTGRVTGPHLHYEIRKNGTPVDPMKYF